MSTTVWDDKARSCLLLAIMTHAAPTNAEWKDILEYTREHGGYNYTQNAAQ
jgi:hypothetical protein